jgi:hypothetical protein
VNWLVGVIAAICILNGLYVAVVLVAGWVRARMAARRFKRYVAALQAELEALLAGVS